MNVAFAAFFVGCSDCVGSNLIGIMDCVSTRIWRENIIPLKSTRLRLEEGG